MTDQIQTTNSNRLLRMKRGGAWLLFSETRRISKSKSIIYSDTVEISLRTALGQKKVMEMRGEASSGRNTVSFSDGFIHVAEDWQGCRIGTYMLNRLVTWAKETYPEYRPININLGHHQEASKEMRNRLYKRFEFRFEWDDDEFLCGHLESMMVSELKGTDLWMPEIEEFELRAGLETLCRESDHVRLELDGVRFQQKLRIDKKIAHDGKQTSFNIKLAWCSFAAGAVAFAVLQKICSV